MDIMMPEMDGFEAIKAIRNEARYKAVPIIAVTAKALKEDRERCIRAGASDYLPKPFDPDELTLIVKRAVEMRSLRLQNARLRTEASIGRAMVAESPPMRRLLELIVRVAPKLSLIHI